MATERTTEEKAVVDTLQAFLDALERNDAPAMRELILPLGGVTIIRKGKPLHLTLSGLVDRLSGLHGQGHMKETIHDYEVRIDHDIAVIWAPFEVFFDGSLHHVGTNIVTFWKSEGKWLLSGVADTNRGLDE